VESTTSMQDLEFILSEAKEPRDRAVLERGYDCASSERPAELESVCVRRQ
jgi:hypothetical protein